jgi:diguanylate cyclase (GGDEF)-like protein
MDRIRAVRIRRASFRALVALVSATLLFCQAHGLDPKKAITQYMQTAWTSESGLPQNSVHAIAQTADGFLWVGTEEGLARFDGVQFTVFSSRNTRGLASDYIQALAASRDGSLWIGTDSGLSHFVPAATGGGSKATLERTKAVGYLTAKDGLPADSVTALWEDRDGTIWVGTAKGLSRIRNERVESTELAGLAIHVIIADSQGRLWIGTEKGLYESDHGRLIDWSARGELPGIPITALAADPDGSVWIGTLGHGLAHFRDGRLFASPRLPWNEVGALLFDRDGVLWISLDRHGIARLFRGALTGYGTAKGLPTNRITHALFEDHEGSLWVGLLDAGVVQLREGKFAVFGQPEGLSGNYVGNVLEARDGTMWIGSDSNGLNHLFPDGRVEIWNQSRGLPNQAVYSLLQSRDGSLWIGFRRGALARIHDGRVSIYKDPKAAGTSVNALFEDREGNLWVGFFGKGLARFKDGQFQHLTDTSRIPAITQSPDGAIWVATDGDGVERIFKGANTRVTTANGLPSNHVMCLYADADGDVWVGTASGGLSRIRGDNVVSWTPDQGLPGATVGSIVEDNAGNLWIGGDSGIYSLSKQRLNQSTQKPALIESPVLYGATDGLRSRETFYGSMPSTWKGRDGRMWFATIRGAAVLDPARVQTNTTVPPVWIENVTFDSRPVPLEDGDRLGPGSGNLEVSFTAPSFVASRQVNFRYRLAGFDGDWINAGSRRHAWYTNLPPGRYTFTAQAENGDGIWNQTGDSFSFVIRPPLTRTPIAYVLYGISILLAVWGAIVLRTRALIRRQQELTRIVAERTAQLEAEKAALEAAREELHIRATYDSLTGLLNRAAIVEHLQREVHRAIREKTPLGVLIADLDFFKHVNDTYGHLCGDDVISEAADRFRAAMRRYDLAGRYGGEEFLILFPGWDPDLAPGRVESLLDGIRSRPFDISGNEIHLTCSIGVSTFHPGIDSPEIRDVLSRADAALYAAKNDGRNRASIVNSTPNLHRPAGMFSEPRSGSAEVD